jgi:L-rhamnose mutarotase
MLFKRTLTYAIAILLGIMTSACTKNNVENNKSALNKNQNQGEVTKRVGMVIGVKPDKVAAYEALHADNNPGVRDLLNKYHMQNFSIFIKKFPNGKYYEFGYYEYTGNNYEKDMADLAKESRNIEWLEKTDPMQIPLEGENGWAIMQKVYYNK